MTRKLSEYREATKETLICRLTSSQEFDAGLSNEAGRFSHDVQPRLFKQLKLDFLFVANGRLRPSDLLLQHSNGAWTPNFFYIQKRGKLKLRQYTCFFLSSVRLAH
jgi:hypothetical protein